MGLMDFAREALDAAPEHFPEFEIETQTKSITDPVAARLIELRLSDRSGGLSDAMELELADDGMLALPEIGKRLKIGVGYRGQAQRRRWNFTVDQVEHSGPPALIRLSGTTADFTSQARAPQERSYGSLTLGELIKQLASEHGLKARVMPEELARVQLEHVDQAGQSDLTLVWQTAQAHDALFKPVDDVWWVRSYEDLGEPTATIVPGNVSTWRAHFLARTGYASVKAHYHDFETAKRVPVVVGEGQPQLTLDATYVDEAQARFQAKAAMSRARRDSRRLVLRMPGRPDLTSQQVIALDGFRERVDDKWLVTEVVHTINKRGYTSRVSCQGV